MSQMFNQRIDKLNVVYPYGEIPLSHKIGWETDSCCNCGWTLKISQKKGAAESEGCCGLILLIWSDQNSHSHRNPADHGVAKQMGGDRKWLWMGTGFAFQWWQTHAVRQWGKYTNTHGVVHYDSERCGSELYLTFKGKKEEKKHEKWKEKEVTK